MKIFRIDFAQDNPCVDGCYVGRIGEHNATELVITPPAAMTENEAVTSYIIAFVTGGMLIHSEPFEKAETVHIKLWRQLTQNATIGIQLEAYDDAGDFIGKSEYIKSLKFLPSADGDNVSSDTDNPDLISEFLKIKHSHENKEMLDKFSEDDDGNPLYNGQSIGNGVGSGITDEQAAEIAANTESRHTHGNKTVSVPADEVSYTHYNIQDTSGTAKGALDEAIDYVTGVLAPASHSHKNAQVLNRLEDNNGALTYNGKPIGGSGATERPTAVYVYDFVEDFRVMSSDDALTSLYIMYEEATNEEKALINKEIADVSFSFMSDGEVKWVSLKDMYEAGSELYILVQSRIVRCSVDNSDVISLVSVFYPANGVNCWLRRKFNDGFLKMRVTYYTD